MTIHIAFSSPKAAVLACDSQSSYETSEAHGLQKQFAGPDFLVGVAGSGVIQGELFARLEEATAHATNGLSAAGVKTFVEQFLREEVQPAARREVEIVVVTPPDVSGRAVQLFRPGILTRIGRSGNFASIGSGSEFVHRAFELGEQLGMTLPLDELSDLLVAVELLARAADVSLTVDDALLFGIFANGKTYLMGDDRIQLHFAPPLLRLHWTDACDRFRGIIARCRAINLEVVRVQQVLSAIRTGGLDHPALDSILESNDYGITPARYGIARQLDDYFAWYDGLLGRP